MHVRRVILTHLRGFEAVDFSFERPEGQGLQGWSVITGDNGSGKTTLLKAIALALAGPERARMLQPDLRGWIHEGADKATVQVEVAASELDRFSGGGRLGRSLESFWCELELATNGGPEVGVRHRQLSGHTMTASRGPWSEASGWFAAGYGPFRRLYGTSPEAARFASAPDIRSRFATLFREDATLSEGEEWLKDLDHRRLEGKVKERLWLAQVKSLLNQDFLTHGVRIERVDSDGLWLKDSAGIELPIRELSDGYRAALATMVDLVRHVVVSLPADAALVEETEDGLVVPHAGVVLVDEIDAHLHPSWQRRIGEWMTARFPQVQFLVTTHSPLVCASADPGGIFHLPAPGSGKPFRLSDQDFWEVKRARADQILLTPAFGLDHTRSMDAVEARLEHARLKAKQKSVGLTPQDVARLNALGPFVADES